MTAVALDTTTAWGAVLRAARLRQSLSQDDLAARVGTTREWVGLVESGAPRLEFDKVLRTAAILGIELQPVEDVATTADIEEADEIAWDMAIDGQALDEVGYGGLVDQVVHERQRRGA